MSPRPARPRISFAEITIAGTPAAGTQVPLMGLAAALRESLRPGTSVTRYDRVWHIGQNDRDGGYIVGRIGFEREGQTIWSEKAKDFRVGRTGGSTSRFVIDTEASSESPETLNLAFQLRPGIIEPGTFRYNFQALLNTAVEEDGAPWRWSVSLKGVEQPSWEKWQEEVERIVRLRITMHRPNPRFPGDKVEALFEGAKLKAAEMALTAKDGESIDLDEEFVMQAIELAKDHGHIKATGEVVEGGATRPVEWSDAAEKAAVKKEVPPDPNSPGEPSTSAMEAELRPTQGGSG
jgi:hypothetical protein